MASRTVTETATTLICMPRLGPALALTGCAVVVSVALTGCKGIDKSQWTKSTSAGTASTGSGSGSGSGTRTKSGGSGSGGSGTGSGSGGSGSGSGGSGSGTSGSSGGTGSRTTAPAVAAGVTAAANDLGIAPGSNGGSRRPTVATVLVRAAPDVCWILTLDGNGHYGCGSASLSDTLGLPAARLTKTSGPTMVAVQLVAGGRTLSTGAVVRIGRFVTVQA